MTSYCCFFFKEVAAPKGVSALLEGTESFALSKHSKWNVYYERKTPKCCNKVKLIWGFFINNVELSLLKGFVESSWTLNVFFFFNFKQDNNFYINNKMYLLSSINRMGNYSWFVISSSETAFGLHWIQIKQFEQIR